MDLLIFVGVVAAFVGVLYVMNDKFKAKVDALISKVKKD